MNVDFPDVKVPYSGGMTPSSGTNDNIYYDYVLTTDKYQKATLDSGTMLVTGNAQLYVPGNVSLSGITILSNASLTLYVGGASVSLSGNGVINQGGKCHQFLLLWAAFQHLAPPQRQCRLYRSHLRAQC